MQHFTSLNNQKSVKSTLHTRVIKSKRTTFRILRDLSLAERYIHQSIVPSEKKILNIGRSFDRL